MEIKMALDGINTVLLMFWVLVISLLSTIATPLAFGCSGSIVFIISNLLPKIWWSWSLSSSVRCVSCGARMPIFLSLMIWFILYHFSVSLPLMFRVAILIAALVFFFIFFFVGLLELFSCVFEADELLGWVFVVEAGVL